MRRTVQLALDLGVAIGAHPGYRDRENFGRTAMSIPQHEVTALVCEQLDTLAKVCDAEGATLHHVKPHGALYNQAAKDRELAAAIARAVIEFDRKLILYGLSGSHLIRESEKLGLVTASEVFADRTYQSDGSLTPRSQPNALIENDDEAARQAIMMADRGEVVAIDGEKVVLTADTICLHGDGAHAVEFANKIRSALDRAGWSVEAPHSQ